MITEHKKLLETIEAAVDQADALKRRGEGVEGIVRSLRDAARQTGSRISYYETAAREKKSAVAAPAAPQTQKQKEDPKP